MHLSLVLAAALCTAPGFESAVRVTDRQAVESYVYKTRAQLNHIASPDPKNLRFEDASVSVDLFIDGEGNVKAICRTRGDERLMPIVTPRAQSLHFKPLSRG